MATIYILYSNLIDRFYIGSCENLTTRLEQHLNKEFEASFTSKTDDWIVFFSCDQLNYQTARKIEAHIKRMKSRKYLHNLKLYPEIISKLITLYEAGSSR